MRIVRYNYPSYRNLASVPAFFARSPWSSLESEIDRLFVSAQRFPVDLYEDKDNAYVRAELPGVNRDDVQVEMTDGILTISAARKTPSTDVQTTTPAPITRSLSIPAEISADKVSAAYENGVLTVTLPKREEAKPRKVTVAVK